MSLRAPGSAQSAARGQAPRSNPESHARLWIASALLRLAMTTLGHASAARSHPSNLRYDPLFRTVDQSRRHANGGAARRHIVRDDRAGTDLGEVADADVAQDRRSCGEVHATADPRGAH